MKKITPYLASRSPASSEVIRIRTSTVPRIILLLTAARGFDRGLLSGVAKYAALHGQWNFFREPHGYYMGARKISTAELKAWKPDAAMCPVQRFDGLIRPLRVPVVTFDVNDYDGPVPGIITEDEKAGRLAAEHLLGLGLDQFAFCGVEAMRWSADRCHSFCRTIADAGHSVDVFRPKGRPPKAWATEEPRIREWLQELPKPVGLFCANDDRSANILECCRAVGCAVPQDIAVVGVDDDPTVCELTNPPLSSVAMSSERAGYEAAELLHSMILGKTTMSGQRVLARAAGVVARQSTDILMVRDVSVRTALQFMRENLNQPIQVREIVRVSGLSHRTLNDRFYRECGTSILKQLTKMRIDHISRLLRETDLSISKVAQLVGFESDRHIARYFRRATNCSPQEYRRQHSAP